MMCGQITLYSQEEPDNKKQQWIMLDLRKKHTICDKVRDVKSLTFITHKSIE